MLRIAKYLIFLVFSAFAARAQYNGNDRYLVQSYLGNTSSCGGQKI